MALPDLRYAAGNNVSTTLNGAITNSALSLTVSDAAGMGSDGGYLVIDPTNSSKEIVYYSSKAGNVLTIPAGGRGLGGTSAAAHNDGATVTDVLVDEHINAIITQFLVEHNSDGTHSDVTATTVVITGDETVGGNLAVTGTTTSTGLLTATAGLSVADAQDIAFASGAKIERDGGHINLTPESNKLVKLAALRQDNTTNTYSNNQVILTGWGFILGDGTDTVEETITFGVTFAAAPVVLVSFAGIRDGSDPTTIADLTATIAGTNPGVVGTQDITTTGFQIDISRPGSTIANTRRVGYTWIAIGTLS